MRPASSESSEQVGNRRQTIVDLFCGAGGCSVGYERAGFEVVGIDIAEHPDYPFELYKADAFAMVQDAINGCWHESYHKSRLPGMLNRCLGHFDVIHASPPCPRYSTITPHATRDDHPDFIPPIREMLQAWGGLYVIENVPGAIRHMHNPVRLCGSSFGLRVRRHRLFESNAPLLWSMPCEHERQGRPVGVYGDHPQNDHEYRRPDGTRRGAKATSIVDAQDALGIDWMTTWDDLTDAIPPAYTEFIGRQLLDVLAVAA